MSKEFISVNLDISVGDTIEMLKEMKPDEEVIHYIYITNEEEHIQEERKWTLFKGIY